MASSRREPDCKPPVVLRTGDVGDESLALINRWHLVAANLPRHYAVSIPAGELLALLREFSVCSVQCSDRTQLKTEN